MAQSEAHSRTYRKIQYGLEARIKDAETALYEATGIRPEDLSDPRVQFYLSVTNPPEYQSYLQLNRAHANVRDTGNPAELDAHASRQTFASDVPLGMIVTGKHSNKTEHEDQTNLQV